MATLITKNSYVSLAAVDLSQWVESGVINDETEAVEETAMGDDTRKNKAGLYNGTWELTFRQDYAAGGPDATYWASLRGVTFTAICNPDSSTTSTTNPRFTQTMIVTNYQPVNASIGGLATATMTLSPAGDLARATV
jgi:hypothetical protein